MTNHPRAADTKRILNKMLTPFFVLFIVAPAQGISSETINCTIHSMGGGGVSSSNQKSANITRTVGAFPNPTQTFQKHDRVREMNSFDYDGKTLVQRGEITVFQRYSNVFEVDDVIFAIARVDGSHEVRHVVIDRRTSDLHGGIGEDQEHFNYEGECTFR